MKRIYHPYDKWEDYKHGLFGADEQQTTGAAKLLATPEKLHAAMTHVSRNWKHAAEVNMTNRSRNRQAWLGQAACCYACGANEDTTKRAWRGLTDTERTEANAVADVVIIEWESYYQELLCPRFI